MVMVSQSDQINNPILNNKNTGRCYAMPAYMIVLSLAYVRIYTYDTATLIARTKLGLCPILHSS